MNAGVDEIIKKLKEHGLKTPPETFYFSLKNADYVFRETLSAMLSLSGKSMQWHTGYDEIVKWLSNNNGKGLYLYGTCGVGKTFISRYVLPAIFLQHFGKILNSYDSNEMNNNPDEVLIKKNIVLDDIGTEDISVSYGNRRSVFSEVIDSAEKYGKLLIVTTNLNRSQIIEKYGNRVSDRIISTTKQIEIKGESLRT